MKKSISTLFFFFWFFVSSSTNLWAQYDAHYLKKGNAAFADQNYVQAEQDYTQSLKNNSRNMEAYYRRGIVRVYLQKYQEATRDFDKIMLFKYKVADAIYWKGRIAYAQQNYKLAIEHFDEALNQEASQKAEIYTYKGFAYQKLKDLDKAEKSFTLAINEGAKNEADIYYELGEINYYQKDYKESLNNFQQSLRIGHPNREKIINKINTLRKLIASKEVKFIFFNPQTVASRTSQPFFDIKASLQSDSKIDQISVLVNGQEPESERGLVVTPKENNIINFSRKIYLQEGINQIQLVAQTAYGNFESEIRTIEYIPTDLPRVWAVVVGISTYSHLPTLRYSDDDAYKMFAFLKSPEGGALPDEQITILVDENATKQNIIAALSEKFAAAGENDLVLFYYAGHGLEGSLVPFDYDTTVPSTRLMHSDVEKIFTSSKAKNKLFVADACHSGSSVEDFRGIKESVASYYQALAKTSGGMALMMSSRAEEGSIERKELRQGVFSYYLIRGLQGDADADGNGIITVRELFNYTKKQTTNYTQFRQNPELFGMFDPNMPIGVVRR